MKVLCIQQFRESKVICTLFVYNALGSSASGSEPWCAFQAVPFFTAIGTTLSMHRASTEEICITVHRECKEVTLSTDFASIFLPKRRRAFPFSPESCPSEVTMLD